MNTPSNSSTPTTTPELEIDGPPHIPNSLRQYHFAASPGSNNLHRHQPPPHVPVTHAECLRNHAIGLGGHTLDGCGNFMASSTTVGDPVSLICAACGCHRSFHRRRELEEHRCPAYLHFAPPISAPKYINLGHPIGRSSSSSSPPPLAPPQQMVLLHSTAAADQQVPNHQSYVVAPPLTMGTEKSKKRFRTKFTKLQKDKMHSFAESMGWKILKDNHNAVENFCREIGIAKNVLKVWMHNHKKKNVVQKIASGSDATTNDVGENASTYGSNGSGNRA